MHSPHACIHLVLLTVPSSVPVSPTEVSLRVMESKQYPILDPLAGLSSDLPALPTELNEDGKSIQQLPPRDERSAWYEGYPELFNIKEKHRANAFDFHVYYCGPAQTAHARALYERVRREFPELRVYKFWEHPVGSMP